MRLDHQVTSVRAKPGIRTNGTRISAQKMPKYETVRSPISKPSLPLASEPTSNRPASKCAAMELNARPKSNFRRIGKPSSHMRVGYQMTTTRRARIHGHLILGADLNISRVYPNRVECRHKEADGRKVRDGQLESQAARPWTGHAAQARRGQTAGPATLPRSVLAVLGCAGSTDGPQRTRGLQFSGPSRHSIARPSVWRARTDRTVASGRAARGPDEISSDGHFSGRKC